MKKNLFLVLFFCVGMIPTNQYAVSDLNDSFRRSSWRYNSAGDRKRIITTGIVFANLGKINAKQSVEKITIPGLNKMVGFTYVPTEGKLLNKNIWIILRNELINGNPFIKIYGFKGDPSFDRKTTTWKEMATSKIGLAKDDKKLVGKIKQDLPKSIVTVHPDGSIQIKSAKDAKGLMLPIDILE